MTRNVTLAGYAALLAAIVAYELAARRRGTATFSDAVTTVARHQVGKALLLAGWLWLGWHLFVRASD
jgi:hypothetical protein